MRKSRARRGRWLAFGWLLASASCAISEQKHACHGDEDCLYGRVCALGFCGVSGVYALERWYGEWQPQWHRFE